MSRLSVSARLLASLVLALFPGGCGNQTPHVRTLDLTPRLLGTTFVANRFQPAEPAQRTLATRGWYAGVVPPKPGGWLQASSKRAVLQLPADRDDFSRLSLHVRSPPFLPFRFTVSVEINGLALGVYELPKDGKTLSIEISPKTLRQGLNEVVLSSSHLMSPLECGTGKSTWREGVHVNWIQLENGEGVGSHPKDMPHNGQSLSIRIPADGELQVTPSATPQRLVIQDLSTGETLWNQLLAKPKTIDYADRAGQEVTITFLSATADPVPPAAVQFTTSSAMPNLVLIVVDTLRFDAITEQRAPSISSLAKDGIAFSSSFVHAPMTLPSHTSLFTASHPHQTGITTNGQVVPEELPLLSAWLGSCGYDTMAIASLATLWQFRSKEGLDQGFDEFRHVERDYSHGADTAKLLAAQLAAREAPNAPPLFLFAHLADPHEPYRSFEGRGDTLSLSLDGDYLASANPKRAPHLRATSELLPAGEYEINLDSPTSPFVMRSLYVRAIEEGSETAVKVKIVEGKRLDTLHALRATFRLERASQVQIESWVCDHPDQAQSAERYLREVEQADQAIGEILKTLKREGLYDSSLILFTSDHGEAFGEHQLNGHSQNLFDELLHVPTIIKLPKGDTFQDARAALTEQKDSILRHIDLAPTALSILGLPDLPNAAGGSLLAKDRSPVVLFAETHQPEAERDQYCMRDDNYKLIYYPDEQVFQMFDVRADPLELVDIFAKSAHQRDPWQQRLRQVALQWASQTAADREPSALTDIEALGY